VAQGVLLLAGLMSEIEREATLFVAGEYPDRDLVVTEEDIARLAQTPLPIPIFVEHQPSAFRLGEVVSLRAVGRYLIGRLKLFAEADELLSRLNLRSLSVAISRALDRVLEVSITDSPRVAEARMFNDHAACLVFHRGDVRRALSAENGENEEDHAMAENEELDRLRAEVVRLSALETQFQNQFAQLQNDLAARTQELNESRQAVVALTAAMRQQEAARQLESFADRIPPAARSEALQLLQHEAPLTFRAEDGTPMQTSVGALFAQFCEKLPAFGGKPITGRAATDEERKAELIAFYKKRGLTDDGAAKAAEIHLKGDPSDG
jgi:hypothetical protein